MSGRAACRAPQGALFPSTPPAGRGSLCVEIPGAWICRGREQTSPPGEGVKGRPPHKKEKDMRVSISYDSLEEAIRKGNRCDVAVMIKAGVDVEFDALCVAAACGRRKIAKLLIKSGLRVDGSFNGKAPINFAAQHGHAKMARFLIDEGAKIDGYETRGGGSVESPLVTASKHDRLDVARLLIEAGASGQSKNRALKAAVCHLQHPDIVRLLLDHGADPAARTESGEGVLEHAKNIRIEFVYCHMDPKPTEKEYAERKLAIVAMLEEASGKGGAK